MREIMNILAINSCSGLSKPKSGGQNRFYNLITGLKQYNSVCALIPQIYKDDTDGSLGEVHYFTSNMGQQTFNILTDFNPTFITDLSRILRENNIDIIQISHPYGLFITRIFVKLFSPNTKIVLDAQDVSADLMEVIDVEEYKGINKLFTQLYILFTPLMEKIAVRCADHVLTVSKKDKQRFISKYRILKEKIWVIPSGANLRLNNKIPGNENSELKSGQLKNEKSKNKQSDCFMLEKIFKGKLTIFFHGSYFHPPNRKAAALIRDYIAPKIPDAEFIIAGYQMPVSSSENVKSIGFIEDIYSIMRMVDMAIVPIKEGSGTRLKIMDYFMMGLAVVTTKKGIEGIEANNMENALIVDDVDDNFICAINYLLENPEKRAQMGENNIKLFREKYDYQKITLNLHHIYCEILSEDR
jgi:polysaccharide biosynthesis protein PslH